MSLLLRGRTDFEATLRRSTPYIAGTRRASAIDFTTASARRVILAPHPGDHPVATLPFEADHGAVAGLEFDGLLLLPVDALSVTAVAVTPDDPMLTFAP